MRLTLTMGCRLAIYHMAARINIIIKEFEWTQIKQTKSKLTNKNSLLFYLLDINHNQQNIPTLIKKDKGLIYIDR